MKIIFLVCLLLIVPLVGTVCCPVVPPRTKSLAVSSDGSAREMILKQLELPRKLFEAGDFHQAAALLQRGCQDAIRVGEIRIATRFLNNLGGCRFALHQYQEALRALLEAAGDMQSVGALYSQLGQLDAAATRSNGSARVAHMARQPMALDAYFVTGDQQ